MCLTLLKDAGQVELKVAEEDIVCYKILAYSNVQLCRSDINGEEEWYDETRWVSIYRSYPYEFGVVMEATLDVPVSEYDQMSPASMDRLNTFGTATQNYRARNKHEVNLGLHTYASLDDARDARAIGQTVCKARIPKGASYYEGYFNHRDTPSYASNQLIVDETLSPFK